MTFEQSVRTCLRKYADFRGEASRSEYWWFVLFIVAAGLALSVVSHVLSGLFSAATLLPAIAAAARRLHDTNRSGWWQLVAIVPFFGILVLAFLLVQEGEPGGEP